MNQRVLSNLTLRVDNVSVEYKPNTLEFVLGEGESSVKGTSQGGGASGIAVSENIETFVGMIQFELFTNDENIAFFKQWKNVLLSEGLPVKIFGQGFTGTLTNAILTNNPNMKTGVDEAFEVVFHGNRMT